MSEIPDTVSAIETEALGKSFGEIHAVDGVDLRVPPGVVHGLLGPNGAGKTTAIRMLATLLRPDSGTARVFGHDVVTETAAVRRRIALTGQFASVDENISGHDNLVLIARLLGHSKAAAKGRASELVDAFDLAEAAGRPAGKYSGGMRRRLDIAASIVITPDLLFLDEPTAGLDPRSRNQVWRIVRALVAEGTTILLTTQYLDEADQLADHISVLDHGRIIASGTSTELKSSVGASTLRVRLRRADERPRAQQLLTTNLGVEVHHDGDPATLAARVADPDRVIPALGAVAAAEIGVADFSLGQPSLDEVFLALTGRPVDAAETNGAQTADTKEKS